MSQSTFSWKKFWNRLTSFWLQVFFYSVLLFLVAVKMKWIDFNIKELSQTLLPITTSRWWFATDYVMLYIFTPYINVMLNNLTKKQYNYLVLSLIGVASAYQTLFRTYSPIKDTNINNLIIFVMFYIIGAYFRKYTYKNTKVERNIAIITFFSIWILNACKSFFIGYISYKTSNPVYLTRDETLSHLTSLVVVLLAISMFVIFKNTHIKYNKTINILAFTTFGIYLIHDNNYIRGKLWNDWFNVVAMYRSYDLLSFIVHIFVIVVLIFSVCSLIEYMRIKLFVYIAKVYQIIKHKIATRLKH